MSVTVKTWPFKGQQSVDVIRQESDLPAASGGERQLADDMLYVFDGFISSADTLVLGSSSVLIGAHGAIDGFIHTGGSTAIKGTDVGFFARDMLISAPGGTALNLNDSTDSKEMLVESVSIADPAGMGDIASLGTVTGYRVPTFKGCNFEDFDGGLTFDGSPKKIFFSESPFRTVTASGVTCLTFAGSLSVDIVDIVNCYVKGVQSDTEVVRVETGATPSGIFQYRGVTHDSTVTASNVLTGEAGVDEIGYQVQNASPLRNSAVIGELDLDSATTTTLSAQDTWAIIEGAGTLGAETARITSPADGTFTYEGRDNVNVQVIFSGSMTGGNGDTYQIGIFVNGNLQPASTARFEAGGGQSEITVMTTAIERLTPTDDISIRVKNLDSATDPTFESYNFNLGSI